MTAILTRVLTAHYLRGWRAGNLDNGAICACGLNLVWYPSERDAVDAYVQHVVTLVTAETQAEVARQCAQRQATGHLGEPVEEVWPR